jgi:DNA-directed RNA polymerase subunit RPC12/RpoP
MKGCRHKYVETEKEDNGYWFRCIYCGDKIFGRVKFRERDKNEQKEKQVQA